jgi:hypothetical protein
MSTLQRKARSGLIHLERWVDERLNFERIRRMHSRVAELESRLAPQGAPVVFFNASTRILRLSQNAAFSLLASWGLRLAGTPALHFLCEAGMSQCQLGAVGHPPPEQPPCEICVHRSHAFLPQKGLIPYHFEAQNLATLAKELQGLSLAGLEQATYQGLALGALCRPSLHWAQRRQTIPDEPATRRLMRQFILSAAQVADSFATLIEDQRPQAAVLFNGISFPEAVAREVALQRGLRVVTHEVGIRPLSAFFSHGHATAYPIDIPDVFELDAGQNARLDAYLSERFQGEFTMAGIRFWPEMRPLSAGLEAKIAQHQQMVAVFSNVIFDTSQVHANMVFEDMFHWLDQVLDLAQAHPDTLFVIRAHPDESRSGKQSRETVESKVKARGALEWPNLVFIAPQEYSSSYELIQRSKFVMVYNSTIGLEASLMGAAVLCGGASRYTRYPTVYFPPTIGEHQALAESFLAAQQVEAPPDMARQARRFAYYQFFRSSLDFSKFLRSQRHARGQVMLRRFSARELHPDACPETAILREGILAGAPFEYAG